MNRGAEILHCGHRRVSRRALIGGLAALPLTPAKAGWARTEPPTVGYLFGGEKGGALDVLFRKGVEEGLAEQGFGPDKLRWLHRHGGIIPDRGSAGVVLAGLARELVTEGADVIVANGPAVKPAMAVADAVPVIYNFSGDPIAAGLADSLAKPRGNATGITLMMVETNAKRIQLLKDLAPAIRRIALLSSPNHPGEAGEIEVCRRTVASLGIELLYMPVYSNEDVEKVLQQASLAEADAVVALPDPVTNANRARVAGWAIDRRIPSASGWAMYAESGALMTYGPNLSWCYRRVGYYAARILGGAKAAELPIEQPTRFELVINLRTARAIGLAISDALVERADRVIE